MSLVPNIRDGDWRSVRQAIAKLASIKLGTGASPTFAGLTLSGLTQGSVLFAGSGGVISQDNAKLFWDDTNNRLGIGTNTPVTTLDIIGALKITDGGLLSTGIVTGYTIPSGGGTRMMWIPIKGAFRAGTISGNKWNEASIGEESLAFGFDGEASGIASTHFGSSGEASGTASTHFGSSGIASGTVSTHFGSSGEVTGNYSTHFGGLGIVSGNYSTHFGLSNLADAYGVITLGRYSETTGAADPAIWADGEPIFVAGNGTSAASRATSLTIFNNGDISTIGKLELVGSAADTDQGDIYHNGIDLILSPDVVGTGGVRILTATDGAVAKFYMDADRHDDAGDSWLTRVVNGGVWTLGNDINVKDTYVPHVTITPDATVANSTFAIAGALTVGSTIDGGAVTATGLSGFDNITVTGDMTNASLITTLTGTVSVVNGSTTITGTGGAEFDRELVIGDAVKIASDVGAGFEIFTVVSFDAPPETKMTVDSAYQGSNNSGLSYWKDAPFYIAISGDGNQRFSIDGSGRVIMDGVTIGRQEVQIAGPDVHAMGHFDASGFNAGTVPLVLTSTNSQTWRVGAELGGTNNIGMEARVGSGARRDFRASNTGFHLLCSDNDGVPAVYEGLTILELGNTGIMTTNPGVPLEINGLPGAGGAIKLVWNDNDGSATDYALLAVDSDGGLTITTVDSDGAAGDITLSPDGLIKITTDFIFSGAGTGLPYGEIYVNDNTTVTSVSSAGFTQFLHFDNNGHANLSTPEHAQDHIKIVKAGVYMVECCVNIKNSSGAAHNIEVVIAKLNGTIFPNMRRHRTLGTGTDVGAIPICGHLSLAVDDTIEVWITSDSASARDVTAEDVVLMLTLVGGI